MMLTSQSSSILIVDDNPTNLKVLLDVLTSSGYRVTIAKNGKNALAKARRTQPDLILLDVLMPGIDGFETCRRLKTNEETCKIPIIFITALSETVNKIKGLQLGGVDYITKPFDQDEVLARIQVHLDLKKAQLQLIQESKLSTLGELVAGIAHEVNNSINFVYGNLTHATQYHREIIHLLELYENCYPNPPANIQDWQEQIELSFLKPDYLKLLDSMKTGVERIKRIVISLRSFSKLDEAEWKQADLNEGLKSTLILLSQRLHAKSDRNEIQAIEQYGELPLVYCNPAELNQVFMNVLVNAIDAIDEKFWHARTNGKVAREIPQVILTTTLEITEMGKQACIRIIDNGIGISESVRSHIFEQFFTTKSMGKGTGLGLAIARQIVEEKHGGAIACYSERGKGTEFVISLPIK